MDSLITTVLGATRLCSRAARFVVPPDGRWLLPLAPAAFKRLPFLSSRLLVTIDSLNLEATPMTTHRGAHWTELRAQTPQAGNLDGNVFYFGLFEDVTHQYPNGTNNPLGFNMPDRVWPFFEQHPMP